VLENEGVGLCLKSKRVVVDLRGDKGDRAWLLTSAPYGGGLDGVDCLKEGLGGGREVSYHFGRVVGLSVFLGCEELVEGV
jgi:hypothetical protein